METTVTELVVEYDSQECLIAVQAAQRMANHFGKTFAIMEDLSVVPIEESHGAFLEIVGPDLNVSWKY